jgi:hypothetical protein
MFWVVVPGLKINRMPMNGNVGNGGKKSSCLVLEVGSLTIISPARLRLTRVWLMDDNHDITSVSRDNCEITATYQSHRFVGLRPKPGVVPANNCRCNPAQSVSRDRLSRFHTIHAIRYIN